MHTVLGIFPAYDKSIPQSGNLLSAEGSMIDAVLNIAVFAALGSVHCRFWCVGA
jgi:hypothetical protein